MTADEAKAAICAHLGIADHGWGYLVGQIEGRLPRAVAKMPRPTSGYNQALRDEVEAANEEAGRMQYGAWAPAPTRPGIYDVRAPDAEIGDRMELMPDGHWPFLDEGNPSDPLPFIPGGVFTRLPDPPQPSGTLELPLGR